MYLQKILPPFTLYKTLYFKFWENKKFRCQKMLIFLNLVTARRRGGEDHLLPALKLGSALFMVSWETIQRPSCVISALHFCLKLLRSLTHSSSTYLIKPRWPLIAFSYIFHTHMVTHHNQEYRNSEKNHIMNQWDLCCLQDLLSFFGFHRAAWVHLQTML